ALRLRLEDSQPGKLRLRLRWKLFRLLAHLHGAGPAVAGINIRSIRRMKIDFQDPAIADLLHNFLRASIQNLGTGRMPLIDELGFAVAQLNAACALAAMSPSGSTQNLLVSGIMEASDLTHAET